MSEESVLQQNTIELFRRFGWLVHHNYNSIHSEPGMLDMIAVKAPSVIFAEFKGSKGKLTKSKVNKHGRLMPGQEDWIEQLKQCPVLCFVWKPDDWDEIVKVAQGSVLEVFAESWQKSMKHS